MFMRNNKEHPNEEHRATQHHHRYGYCVSKTKRERVICMPTQDVIKFSSHVDKKQRQYFPVGPL